MTIERMWCLISMLLVAGAVGWCSVRVIYLEARRWMRRRRNAAAPPTTSATSAKLADVVYTNVVKTLVEAQATRVALPLHIEFASLKKTENAWPPWPAYAPALPRTVAFEDEPTLELVPYFGEEEPTIPRASVGNASCGDDDLRKPEAHRSFR